MNYKLFGHDTCDMLLVGKHVGRRGASFSVLNFTFNSITKGFLSVLITLQLEKQWWTVGSGFSTFSHDACLGVSGSLLAPEGVCLTQSNLIQLSDCMFPCCEKVSSADFYHPVSRVGPAIFFWL